jgi:hypothetical protein
VGTSNADELLKQGIDDMRNGDRAAARQKFERVVELDENSEKGWMWLASVVETDEEKRICLGNVLHINPNNDRAQKALDALNAKKKQQVAEEEVVPGVTRRQLTLIAGLGIAAVVFLLIVLVVVVSGNNAAAANATQAALAITAEFISVNETSTSAAVNATGTSVAATETQFAIATPVPTATPTSSRATLPPEWTATPVIIETTPTTVSLPPPVGVTGILSVWGGADIENIGFYPIGYYNFDAGSTYTRIGDDIGLDARLHPNGQRVAYTRYDRLLRGTTIDAINLNGQQVQPLAELWRGQAIIQNPMQPVFTNDGTRVVFIGRAENGHYQVFVLDLTTNEVRNLSNDEVDYSYPDVSPDSTRAVVVRTDTVGGTGTDLAIIDLASGGKFALTTDQDTYIETMPRFTSDGSQVVYAAAAQTEPENNDIVVRNADSNSTPNLLVRNDANDLYPVLSTDGRFLAFASDRTGNWEIYVYDIQVQALYQLTNDPAPNYPGDWHQAPS